MCTFRPEDTHETDTLMSGWPFDIVHAVTHLSVTDPALGHVIHRVGAVTMEPRPDEHPFEALLRAIVYQQLSGKAAGTIHGRVLERVGEPPTPHRILATNPEDLRACGLSRAKTAAIIDLAHHTLDGTIPPAADLRESLNEDIVKRFTQVRGVGPWTVQMYLMFGLGRPDILPVTDLGIRKAVQLLRGTEGLPEPEEVAREGAVWQPYRTVASWYLWRSLDLEDAIPD